MSCTRLCACGLFDCLAFGAAFAGDEKGRSRHQITEGRSEAEDSRKAVELVGVVAYPL